MINEKLEHLLLEVYFIGITKMQTNCIIPLLVKNCSQPLDSECGADCKNKGSIWADRREMVYVHSLGGVGGEDGGWGRGWKMGREGRGWRVGMEGADGVTSEPFSRGCFYKVQGL